MPPVVRFDNVSKLYQIGSAQGSLREALAGLATRVLRRGAQEPSDANSIWALKDVSFELEPGQVLGVVGRNGAGKTTLLKLLSRVVQPTSGRIDVSGRVSALIELGAGFHPDLTGRENIYLNGVILGMTRKEIDRKFDSIVEFAELERFIDTPVKRYSSGMYARLGFAVAIHSAPDLLVVDEVLAVGDQAFQQKCYEFIHNFVTSGKTAIFVSHSMYVIEQLCSALLWLDSGQAMLAGDPTEVLPAYLDNIDQQSIARTAVVGHDGNRLVVKPARFFDGNGTERDTFTTGEDIIVGVRYSAIIALRKPHFSLGVVGPEGGTPLFVASMLVDGNAPEFIHGEGELKCKFEGVPLLPRVYSVWGEVWDADNSRLLLNWHKLGTFRVTSSEAERQGKVRKGSLRYLRADSSIRVPYEWQI